MVRLIKWPPAYGPDAIAGCPPHEEAAQQAAILLGTRKGERPDAADFGLAAPLGGIAVGHEAATAAIRRWIPEHAAAITAAPVVDTTGTQYVEITIAKETHDGLRIPNVHR